MLWAFAITATIERAVVTLAGTRAYDGSTNFISGAFTSTIFGTVSGETLAIASGTGTVASQNASAGTQTLTTGTLALGDGSGSAGNYVIATSGNTGTITPAALAVMANAQSKTYGTSDPALTFSVTGLVNNPSLV